MRHEKAGRLLELARMLAATAEGLTLDEMAGRLGVGRRPAERMRDAVRDVFPQLEEVDDPPTRRFRIPAGLDGLFQAPTAEELAALSAAGEGLAPQGGGAPGPLEQRVPSAPRAAARRKLAPDLEALLQAETIAVQAGPRPFEDETVLAAVREALLSLRALRFRYEGGATPGRVREVTPFGMLFGRSNYLVADEGNGARNWRLDRVRDIEVTERPAARPQGFSLQDYADESFGIFHDDTEDVVLRATPAGTEDALRWRFHANQSVALQSDGSVIVRFRASGMLELAWHLFTWGDKIEVVAPEVLQTTLAQAIETARLAHMPDSLRPVLS